MRQLSLNLVNQNRFGERREKSSRYLQSNIQSRFMFMGVFQRKDLEIFIALQRIWIVSYYVLFIRLLYYLLLGNYLGKIIIVGSYRKIMILNTDKKKLKNGGIKIRLRGFLGHHKVLT